MSAFWRDLDEMEPADRYLPPQYRRPEVQATVDMHRRLIYGPFQEREVMPIGTGRSSGQKRVLDDRPVSATPANPLDAIAELMLTLTYGEMMELAAEIWSSCDGGIEEKSLPTILHKWCITRGKKNADAVSN